MKKPVIKQKGVKKDQRNAGDLVFEKFAPAHGLDKTISCYWFIHSGPEAQPQVQKIVPDGFPEIIFHFADPYLIKLKNDWELQPPHLLAGQIRKHFYLGNTGRSEIVGIKFMPAALNKLFGIRMDKLTDRVLALEDVIGHVFDPLVEQLKASSGNKEKCALMDDYLLKLPLNQGGKDNRIEEALSLIFSSNGTVTVKELCHALSIGERQLERNFNECVGLSPKFYSRIIRFSRIFQHIEKGDPFWTDTVYRTGFYDQSHFIKNFKAFTGEEPSEYLFEEMNIANFFLNK